LFPAFALRAAKVPLELLPFARAARRSVGCANLTLEFAVFRRHLGVMIAYQLQCRSGHAFEGWFPDSAGFDAQAADGKLVCPVCNSKKVEKAVMAPAIAGKAREAAEARAALRALRQKMTENAEHVGGAFPEEARKIHYGDAEERAIYGEASGEEVKSLIEEGVPVAPLPPDPDSAN
jgi:hypothetical protein